MHIMHLWFLLRSLITHHPLLVLTGPFFIFRSRATLPSLWPTRHLALVLLLPKRVIFMVAMKFRMSPQKRIFVRTSISSTCFWISDWRLNKRLRNWGTVLVLHPTLPSYFGVDVTNDRWTSGHHPVFHWRSAFRLFTICTFTNHDSRSHDFSMFQCTIYCWEFIQNFDACLGDWKLVVIRFTANLVNPNYFVSRQRPQRERRYSQRWVH